MLQSSYAPYLYAAVQVKIQCTKERKLTSQIYSKKFYQSYKYKSNGGHILDNFQWKFQILGLYFHCTKVPFKLEISWKFN